jgi:endonuclease-3
MQLKPHADKIHRVLKKMYPEVETQLFHRNPFQLLVATILSAQCTDKQVNQVTPVLFKHLKTPSDFAGASLKSIEKWIRPTGFFHNKAKNIKNCARTLIREHDGEVPQSLDMLVKLPGVGRKTANVVLGAAFGIPGVVVDTHVGRISNRLGLTENKNPVKIEYDLMEIIPRRDWNEFCLRLIFFGREICSARKPKCPQCRLKNLCPWPHKTT